LYSNVILFIYSSEIVLKVLAHNNFIGRIIGKGGNIINSIKKETETKFVFK
jgi:insulin-like growth factor 2 mRNA-binding protein 1